MNEDLEVSRAEATKRVLEAMTKVAEDDKQDFPKRLEAAAMVRGISQDLILSDLSSRGLDADSSFKNKLIKHADKLDNRSEP